MEGNYSEPEMLAKREDWCGGVSLYLRQRDGAGGFLVAAPVTMVPYDRGSVPVPTMRLSVQQAQVLMDDLWQCGLRPTEGSGSAGSLAATERHLKDMQTVAMGLLRKDGVQL